MSAGVFRPYTIADVLGTMNQQIGSLTGSQNLISGLGDFGEADETLGAIDFVAGTLQIAASLTWDNSVWGDFTWA